MAATILVGIDSSTPSRSALIWSVRRAVAEGAALELLHVIDSEGVDRDSAEWHELRETAALLLRTELLFARELAPTLSITTNLADGRAEDALVRRSSGHSLLVVGTHKTGFIYGRTFGSRFLGLAWRARCDVAFIPDQVGSTHHGVVAGFDTSPAGEAILRFAAAEAAAGDRELTLVSSWSTRRAPRGAALEAQRAALTRAVELLHASHPDLRVHSRSVELPVAEALIEAAANASLLVIGRPRRPWSSTVSRASNHDILVNMACPVIVVWAG